MGDNMLKVRKIFLILSIIFCLLYAINILLGFTFFFSYLHTHTIIEKIFAFLIGISAFMNILLYPYIPSN